MPIAKTYTTNDGLGSNWTYGIVQDKKGFIWVSSDKGVARFDGTSFVNYDANDGLTDNQVIKLFIDSKDRIWLSNLNGTSGYIYQNKIYNSKQNNFFNTLPIKTSGAYYSEDADGTIYQGLAAASNSILKYTNTAQKIEVPIATPETIIYTITYKNNLYYLTRKGLINATTNTLQKFKGFYPNSYSTAANSITADNKNGVAFYIDSVGVSKCLPNDTIYNIIKFKGTINPKFIRNFNCTNNNLWIALVSGGVHRYTFSKSRGWYYNGFILNGYDINYVFADATENFWFSTSFNGLVYLPAFYNQINIINNQNGLSNEHCYSVKKINNTVFVGGDANKIYVIKNKKIVQTITVQNSINGSAQIFKLVNNKENLYAGFVNGITKINLLNYNKQIITNAESLDLDNNKIRYANFAVKNIAITNNNKLFISGGVRDYLEQATPNVYPVTKKISTGRSYYNYVDNEGNLFISNTMGLCNLVDTNYIPINKNIAIFNGTINAITQVKNGNYLLGNASGIYLYNKNNIVDSVTDKFLLPGLNCKKLISNYNTVWALMETGIIEILIANNKLSVGRRFTLGNGLLTHTPLDLDEGEDNLYIATFGGLYTINKNISFNKNSFATIIAGVFSDNMEYTFNNNATIPFSSKSIRISFDMLSFGIKDKKEFQYRILSSTDWITLTGNSVELIELKHGYTTFEVRGRMAGSDWGDVATYEFFYKKPFYRRKGTQFAALTGLFFIAFMFYQRRQKRLQKEANEKHEMKHKIASLENQALQNLMHPHFVFNSLNSIQHYINSNDKENANRYLSRFAKLIRLNLNSGINGFITIEDEIERLSLYLSLEQLRFEDKLTYNIICPKNIEIDELYLPSMILQPFIENALWHGILNKGEVGNITINIQQLSATTIALSIVDNGIGIANAKKINTNKKHNSKGLLLINTRLQVLSEKYQKPFTINTSIPFLNNPTFPGHTVTLTMPLLYTEDVNKK